MGFPDFPFPNKGRSFVTNEEVLAFFESYAKQFNLRDVIKFRHCVIRVRPIEENRWEVQQMSDHNPGILNLNFSLYRLS